MSISSGLEFQFLGVSGEGFFFAGIDWGGGCPRAPFKGDGVPDSVHQVCTEWSIGRCRSKVVRGMYSVKSD